MAGGTAHPRPAADQGWHPFADQGHHGTDCQVEQVGVVARPVQQGKAVEDQLMGQLQGRVLHGELHDGSDACPEEVPENRGRRPYGPPRADEASSGSW